jgi:hypothetical protein
MGLVGRRESLRSSVAIFIYLLVESGNDASCGTLVKMRGKIYVATTLHSVASLFLLTPGTICLETSQNFGNKIIFHNELLHNNPKVHHEPEEFITDCGDSHVQDI